MLNPEGDLNEQRIFEVKFDPPKSPFYPTPPTHPPFFFASSITTGCKN